MPGIVGPRGRIAAYVSRGLIVKLSDAMVITLLFIQIQQSGWDSVTTGTICCVWHHFDRTPKLSQAGVRAWRNMPLLLFPFLLGHRVFFKNDAPKLTNIHVAQE